MDREDRGDARVYSQHHLWIPGQYLNYLFGMYGPDEVVSSYQIKRESHLRFVDLFLNARRRMT